MRTKNWLLSSALLFAVAGSGFPALAQQSSQAAPPQSTQPAPAQSNHLSSLERYRNSRISIYMNDFGELSRYRDANAALPPPAAGDTVGLE